MTKSTDGSRAEHDFYPTPPNAVHDLLLVEKFKGVIWEPACGDGAISEVLRLRGHEVISSDLIDYGYPEAITPLDFLAESSLVDMPVDHVITNPPYKHAQEFVERSLERSTGKVCMLVRLMFLESQRRKAMFQNTPIARFHIFTKRLDIWRNGEKPGGKNGKMVPYMWAVWEKGHRGPPTINWL